MPQGAGLTDEVLDSVFGAAEKGAGDLAEITVRQVAAAEALAGLQFDTKRRRQMLKNLGEAREGYKALRAQAIGFDEGPAEVFDPRLPGMAFDMAQRPLCLSASSAPPLPGDDESIAFAPLTWLSRWIRERALSSERLTGIYLDRLERYAPALLCAPVIMERQALRAARGADAEIAAGNYRGPLHGIPWGAKDLLDTKGVPTQWGAEPYLGRIPKRDATVVERLNAAGAVLVAKLSLGALAMGDVWNGGMTRNPFDLEQGASGSSAGSASAVAAGLVAFAIGSETLGSIVSPCTRCGVTGLRPTFGRVPRGGAMPLAWSMDKLGPIARGVEDTALVLQAIAGYDPAAAKADPALVDMPFNYDGGASLAGLRIGYDAGEFKRDEHVLDRAARTLLQGLGLELVAVKLPAVPMRPLFPALMVEAAASFDELTRSGRDALLRRQSDDAWPNGFRAARMVPAVEYVQMRRLRRRAMDGMRDLYEKNDLAAFLSPASLGKMLPLSNFTGHPSLTLRTGFSDDGHPHAVTLTGRLYDEGTLLRIGVALERAADAWHARPALP